MGKKNDFNKWQPAGQINYIKVCFNLFQYEEWSSTELNTIDYKDEIEIQDGCTIVESASAHVSEILESSPRIYYTSGHWKNLYTLIENIFCPLKSLCVMNDGRLEMGKALIQFLKQKLSRKSRKFETPCQNYLLVDGFWGLSK